jgi:hypothetical protein
MRLRIHHFFDIIRDFGSGKEIVPHQHGHAYHLVAVQIRNLPEMKFELILASDEVCNGCKHLVDGVCDDIITHRKDFYGKEDFNNYLDTRIMHVCGLDLSKIYSPKELCGIAWKYILNIEFIYEGNDLLHTLKRKENVIKGLKYYSEKHGFRINLNGN